MTIAAALGRTLAFPKPGVDAQVGSTFIQGPVEEAVLDLLNAPREAGAGGKAPARQDVDTGMTVRAVWNGTILAESDDTVIVEGNHYFPPDSVRWDHFTEATNTTVCPWKGTASYYDVVVDGAANPGAAWYYPEPKEAAAEIKDRLAFWKGIEVSQEQ